MIRVVINEDQSFDQAMRRMSTLLKSTGLSNELRRRQYFESPADKRKRKEAASKARARRPQPEADFALL